MTAAAFAAAKVNLHLHVTGRRADGYHALDSLVVFADHGDTVAATQAEVLSMEADGPHAAALGAEEDNLVLRAARALAAAHGVRAGARLRLTKRLPVAAGIGGGSADAAAALRVLSRLWDLPIPAGLPARLGSDVPVCLPQRPALLRDAGETLLPAPTLPDFALLLVNPGVALPTAEVFGARAGPFSAPAALPESWPDVEAMAGDLATLANDLEPAAIRLRPQIAEVLAALRTAGALLARMSGSGATCFGLFPRRAAAEAAAATLPASWWKVAAGPLRDPSALDSARAMADERDGWGVAKR